jgi:predicted HTH transcriptional regulator
MVRLSREIIPLDILEEIVTLGEGFKTEFKATLPVPIAVAKSLCAFANTKGGNLFVGIDDKSVPIGIIDKDEELDKLEESLPLVLPHPDILVKTVFFKNNEIIFIEVKEGKNKPYYVKIDQKTNAYIRVGDVNLPASKKILRTFLNGQNASCKAVKALRKDDRIVFNFFEQNKRLNIEEIREKLNYSEKRLRKILFTLSKLGLVVPSHNEKNVYYKTKEISN